MVVADAGYGEITAFRQGLTDRGIPHVLAVKASTSAHPASAVPEPVPYSGRGPRGADRYRASPSSLRDLALVAGRKHLHEATWRHGTKTGPGNRTAAMKSRFLALRIRPANRDIPLNEDGSLPEAWMLAEWPAHEPAPTDYWLSDLPADTPLKTLVRLAKMRWRIEHDYRELKTVWAWHTSKDAPSPAGTATPPSSPQPTSSSPGYGSPTQKQLGQAEPLRHPEGTPTSHRRMARLLPPLSTTRTNQTKYY